MSSPGGVPAAGTGGVVEQPGEEAGQIALRPAEEGALPLSLEGKQRILKQAQGDDLTREEFGLTVFGHTLHGVVNPTEQVGDEAAGRGKIGARCGKIGNWGATFVGTILAGHRSRSFQVW